MAGAGAKLFTSGSVLTADQVNTFLMDQTIMKFATTTARDAAFGGAGEPTLSEGMFAYTSDTNTLWLYDGAAWVSAVNAASLNGVGASGTSFTPTWSGLTVGNATQNFKYQQVNKVVFVYGRITFGSTTVVTGVMNFQPPIAAVSPVSDSFFGSTRLVDTGSGVIAGAILQTTATNFYPAYFNTSGAFTTVSAMTSTAPFIWVTGDEIYVNFFYEAA